MTTVRNRAPPSPNDSFYFKKERWVSYMLVNFATSPVTLSFFPHLLLLCLSSLCLLPTALNFTILCYQMIT
jgi:hypothetical protein